MDPTVDFERLSKAFYAYVVHDDRDARREIVAQYVPLALEFLRSIRTTRITLQIGEVHAHVEPAHEMHHSTAADADYEVLVEAFSDLLGSLEDGVRRVPVEVWPELGATILKESIVRRAVSWWLWMPMTNTATHLLSLPDSRAHAHTAVFVDPDLLMRDSYLLQARRARGLAPAQSLSALASEKPSETVAAAFALATKNMAEAANGLREELDKLSETVGREVGRYRTEVRETTSRVETALKALGGDQE